jgi:hypothetical protein
MNEAQHIAAIEHDLATAVDRRSRVSLDDIDADVLLRELSRLRNLLAEACDMLSLIGCSPEGARHDIAEAKELQARIRVVLQR